MADTKSVADASVRTFNDHDEAGIRALYSDDAVIEAPGGVHVEGRDASTEYVLVWQRAFPDATLTVHEEVIARDTAVHEFTFEGTHTDTLAGPAGDLPATNRRLVGRGAEIIRVEDGKIASFHLYFDQVDVLTQLGLMPTPATA
jgi:steroid delta-isomerase-like uncharacterized protein